VTTEGNETSDDRILRFFEAAAKNPELIEEYREGGPAYLRDVWGFTDDDIGLIERANQPSFWAMTVFPQPPIVRPGPGPPTVFS
jgi:hypothetical protein